MDIGSSAFLTMLASRSLVEVDHLLVSPSGTSWISLATSFTMEASVFMTSDLAQMRRHA